ncbi:neuromedin-B isoform X5 [Cuculus canorus]|uniref:neuromedin-B isoform X5 n=1 Tax=Cuculus canorus TaxID=55661 RepID=UPI0023AB4062|nr:neuromedin-B isoform X5 [Cuculus canorus]
MWALRCLVLLLCGAALGPAVHLDFAEHRSQAAKIKVNPRGNLWATGHFMGKKSVTGSPHLEPPEEPAVPTAFGPSLRALLEEMVELLTRELLRVLWRERLLDENQGKYDLTDQAEQPQLSQPVLTPTAPCPPYAEESRTGRRTPALCSFLLPPWIKAAPLCCGSASGTHAQQGLLLLPTMSRGGTRTQPT